MPFYDYKCGSCDVTTELFKSYEKVTKKARCESCGAWAKRILFGRTYTYGTALFHEKAFADASEASGEKITSTKQIDKLEKEGKMYAITNPSRARKFKEKK